MPKKEDADLGEEDGRKWKPKEITNEVYFKEETEKG